MCVFFVLSFFLSWQGQHKDKKQSKWEVGGILLPLLFVFRFGAMIYNSFC